MLFSFLFLLSHCISFFYFLFHFPFWPPPSPFIILSFPFHLFFYWFPQFPLLLQMISPRTKGLLGHATITCIQIESQILLCCCTQNPMFIKKFFSSTSTKSCSKLFLFLFLQSPPSFCGSKNHPLALPSFLPKPSF